MKKYCLVRDKKEGANIKSKYMKLELDTAAKTVKFDEDVNLKELFKILKKILPDNEWKEYTLIANTSFTFIGQPYYVVDFSQPLPYRSPSVVPYPWTTCSGSTSSVTLTASGPTDITNNIQGTYTIEIKN